MRNLPNIISNLSKEEKRYFKIYLRRLESGSDENKVERLFDMVNKKQDPDENTIAEILYPNNKNAYYRLKNRLLDDLEKSLLLMHTNITDRIGMMTQICIAKIYLIKLLYKDAYHLLCKIEKQALKAEQYDLLNTIYQEITAMAIHADEINLEEWQEKQMYNAEKYKTWLQTTQIIQNITHRLIKSNFDVRDKSINQTLQELQQKLSIDDSLINSVRMQFELSQTIRRILLQKQDFDALEAYLTSNFDDFEKRGLFTKDTHANKIVTLVWIINTLLKNCKFTLMSIYTPKLYEALQEYKKMLYDNYIWTYYQVLVTQYFYANKPVLAIELLDSLTQQQHSKNNLYYSVFIYGNLGVIYYCMSNLPKAMSSLAPLFYKETFNNLSIELQLRLSILELILHFENQDYNYIEYRLTEMRNSYKELLSNEAYGREKEFISLLRKCVKEAQPFQNPQILKLAQQFISTSPQFGPGSNEFISYQIWLSSKLNKQNYYALILEEVGRRENKQ